MKTKPNLPLYKSILRALMSLMFGYSFNKPIYELFVKDKSIVNMFSSPSFWLK